MSTNNIFHIIQTLFNTLNTTITHLIEHKMLLLIVLGNECVPALGVSVEIELKMDWQGCEEV